MAMSMFGADADELDKLAAAMRSAANDLDREINGLTRLLGNKMWMGPAASDFAANWRGRLAPSAARVSGSVREHAKAAERNASEQRKASEAGVGIGIGGGMAVRFVERPGVKPEDPFDDKHTVREVREYLANRYVAEPKGGALEDMVIQRARNSNRQRRMRQDEGLFDVVWLYKDLAGRPHNDDFPELSAMDAWVLDEVLPWADVQAIQVIGYDGDTPIFAVVTSRLPSLDKDAAAITLGHFILIDKEAAMGDNPNLQYIPNPDPSKGGLVKMSDGMLYHELTHLHRAQEAAKFDEYGTDDRGWYYDYVRNHEHEEDVAYQVGLKIGQYPPEHVVVD